LLASENMTRDPYPRFRKTSSSLAHGQRKGVAYLHQSGEYSAPGGVSGLLLYNIGC
jgi:hypothetical protein